MPQAIEDVKSESQSKETEEKCKGLRFLDGERE